MAAEALRHQHFDRLAQHLRAGIAEHLLGLRIHHLDAAARVDHDHRVRRRLDHAAEALLQPLARRDVDDRRQHHRPLVGLDRIEPDLDRELAAVLAQPEKVAPGAHRPRPGIGEERAAQVGVVAAEALRHQHLHRLAQHLGARIAEHLLGLGIDHLDAPCGADHHHCVRRRFDHAPEALLQPLARGDVDDGRQHHRPLFGLDRIEADLDRKLAAILAQAIEIAPGAHRPGMRIGQERPAQRRVVGAEPRGDQHLHMLAQHLGAVVAENLLGLRVDHFDQAAGVDHHDRIRRGLHHTAEPGVPRLRLAALGDVARDLRVSDQLAVIAADRLHHHVGPEAAAILAHAPAFGFMAAMSRAFASAGQACPSRGPLPCKTGNDRGR